MPGPGSCDDSYRDRDAVDSSDVDSSDDERARSVNPLAAALAGDSDADDSDADDSEEGDFGTPQGVDAAVASLEVIFRSLTSAREAVAALSCSSSAPVGGGTTSAVLKVVAAVRPAAQRPLSVVIPKDGMAEVEMPRVDSASTWGDSPGPGTAGLSWSPVPMGGAGSATTKANADVLLLPLFAAVDGDGNGYEADNEAGNPAAKRPCPMRSGAEQ